MENYPRALFADFKKSLRQVTFYLYLLLMNAGMLGSAFGIWGCDVLAGAGLILLCRQFARLENSVYLNTLITVLVTGMINFHWLIDTISVYGHLPWVVGLLIFLLYCLLFLAKFAAILLGYRWLSRRFDFDLLPLVFLVISTDLIFYELFSWSWGNLLHTNLPLRQHANWLGVHGLSALLVLQAWLLLCAVEIIRKSSQLQLIHQIALVFLVLAYIGGAARLWLGDRSTQYLNVGIVQPNTPAALLEYKSEQAFAGRAINQVVNQSLRLIYDARGQLDLLVLPESAVPFHSTNTQAGGGLYSATYGGAIEFLAKIGQQPVVYNELDNINKKIKNALSVFSPGSKERKVYYKRQLLPFGEYTPFSFLKGLIPESGNYTAAERNTPVSAPLYYKRQVNLPQPNPENLQALLNQINNAELRSADWPTLKPGRTYGIVPLICYEALYPELIKESLRQTTDPAIIVNLTNDAWFHSRLARHQHLMAARLRSIESNLPMVRAAVSGISVAYDRFGSVLGEPLGVGKTGSRIVRLPLARGGDSLYLLWLDWPWYGLCLIFIFWVVSRERKSAQREK